MTDSDIYYAIGDIDDDLIIEAMEYEPKKNKNMRYINKFIAIAACIIMIGIAIDIRSEDIININNMDNNFNMYSVPLDDDFESSQEEETGNIIKIFSEESMVKYLGINEIPRSLSNELVLSDQNTYRIIEDEDGHVIHDNFEIIYTNYDEKYVTINLSKTGDNYGYMFNGIEDPESSQINKISVTIGKFGENKFGAEFKSNAYYTINSDGISEAEFTNILKSIIDSQK